MSHFMKAAVYTKYGPPGVVSVKEIPKPVPADNEVLIRVHASTVNRTDCGFRSAEYFIVRFFSGLFRPKNKVLGNEFAGEIVELGKSVSGFKLGDKVFGYNDKTWGGHGEYMVMNAGGPIAEMPVNFTFDQAAALTEGIHYALADLRAAKIKPGQDYLVNGGTGAIGSAAIQLARYYDCKVTAVCATPHIDLVKSLGADAVIDYTKEDFTKLNQTFDVVFDAVGKSTFGKCKRILKKKGIYMSTELGPGQQNIPLALVTPLFRGRKLLFPIPTINKKDVLFFKELAETGKFKPVIDRSYKLADIVEAYNYVESGMKTGNVILHP